MARVLLFLLLAEVFLVAARNFDDSSSCSSESGSSSFEKDHHKKHHKHHHHHHGNKTEDENKGCPSGWKKFQRPSGGWCIQVFAGAGLQQLDAFNQCKLQNSELSGVQNLEENMWIYQTATATLPAVQGSLWVGARRTDACYSSSLTTTCNQLTSFYWTDSSTTGTDGFIWWSSTNPDNHYGGQPCAVMYYGAASVTTGGWTYFPGCLDDVKCINGIQGMPQRDIQGYVCGTHATE